MSMIIDHQHLLEFKEKINPSQSYDLRSALNCSNPEAAVVTFNSHPTRGLGLHGAVLPEVDLGALSAECKSRDRPLNPES